MAKKKIDIIGKVIATIHEQGENTTTQLLADEVGIHKKLMRRYLQKYKSRNIISYQIDEDGDYYNFIILKDRKGTNKGNDELYNWKQIQTVDIYFKGLEIINNNAVKASDRIKQIDINTKLLKMIDSPVAFERIQQLEEEII